MKNNLKNLFSILALLVIFSGCKKKDYTLGDLNAPSDVVINTVVVGQDGTHPDGDGSGNVDFNITGKNVLGWKIDFDASNGVNPEYIVKPSFTKKYLVLGVNTYTVTVVAYGKGGTSSVYTKDITVRSDFTPDPAIVDNLTGGSSKTWVVDKELGAHFGVGPWSPTSVRPEWYAATPNEKAVCCPCFYAASFKFTKSGSNYTLESITPGGAFTKTGSLAGGLPGIPATGPETCYPYAGGTSAFSFVPSSSGVAAVNAAPNLNSTQTSIMLSGVNTFIGYGAVLKEYEILEITPNTMHLRVQGTETGNAWYIRLKTL